MVDRTDDEGISVPLLWDGLDNTGISFVNQVIVQLGPPGNEGEFIVTFGQLHPPVLMGGDEENKATLERLPYVTVKVVGKFGVPVARVREFRDLLTQMLDRYEKATGRE